MTPVHVQLDDDARDRAALFAMDAMAAAARADYEAHLVTCAACRDEVESLRGLLGELATAAVPAAEPGPDLRERLFRRIHAAPPPAHDVQVWKEWTADPAEHAATDLTYVSGDGGTWEKTAIPGVLVKKLHVDPVADRVTMLIRMAPGTSYPAHRHGGPEDCYVIEGDLSVGDLKMRAGDYQRADGGSRHVVQSTEGGCLLFLTSSLNDELLA